MPMKRVEAPVGSPKPKAIGKAGEAEAIRYPVRYSDSFVPVPKTAINPTHNRAGDLLRNRVPC